MKLFSFGSKLILFPVLGPREKSLAPFAPTTHAHICKICNVVQSVDHVLLLCKGKDLTTNRIIFEDKLCKYVPNYCSLSDEHKLQMVLDFRPVWRKANENEACETIYSLPLKHLSECTGNDFPHFCDMNVLPTLVNKIYLLTYTTGGTCFPSKSPNSLKMPLEVRDIHIF